ncbi:MAG: ABC transporter ATP-binding protein [Eubacteriales bacterium]|nr:ABC transporter ATP-binding protein [Eubacteriales bacterium]
MNNELAIQAQNVTKVYRLYDKPIDRLKESIGRNKCLHRDFYALKGISFDVKRGESVGIIGVNGSGKSTILKIITGVLTATDGTVNVNGKVSALLELGAGFNMDYTGIENVYMNGTMMGFTKAEMDAKLQDILDFADIGDFVNQPVKSYSSGMFVRLAFALAINVEPEILIVDEALSVGDVFFQAKCYHRMDELRKAGTTILMVTHDMSSVLKYCDRTILLNKGELVAEGKPGEMVDLYKKILAGQMDTLSEMLKERNGGAGGTSEDTGNEALGDDNGSNAEGESLMKSKMNVNPAVNEYGNGKATIFDYGMIDAQGKLTNLVLKGESFTIRERIRFNDYVEAPIFTFTIRDKKGNDLTGTNTLFEGSEVASAKKGDEYEVEFKQRMDLQGGEYLISMSCTGFEMGEHTVYHRLYDLLNLTVISNKNTVGVYDTNSEVTVNKK